MVYRDNCLACELPFRHGDKYLPDVSGSDIHFDCLGPELECFVNLETGEPLDAIPEPLIWDDEAFRGWASLDTTDLPQPKDGPFLTTNNADARNAYGLPSHVWLVAMFHADDGQVVAFSSDSGRKLHGLKLYRPVFPAESGASGPSAASAGTLPPDEPK